MTALTRLPDWQLRFDSLLHERMDMAFSWGSMDCCLFASDVVLAITGVDVAGDRRGHRTALQAARTVARHGGIAVMATAALGPPVEVAQAIEGDILLAKAGKRVGLVVCVGHGRALGPSPIGLVGIPKWDWLCAWRVG